MELLLHYQHNRADDNIRFRFLEKWLLQYQCLRKCLHANNVTTVKPVAILCHVMTEVGLHNIILTQRATATGNVRG